MQQIELALGLAIRTPAGAGEERFEELYSRLLNPLLKLVADYNQLILTVSLPGPVMNWFAGPRHNEQSRKLRELVDSNRLIIALCPYYGPELSLTPVEFLEAELRAASAKISELGLAPPTLCWFQGAATEPALRQAKDLGCTTVIADAFSAPGLGTEIGLTLRSAKSALRAAFSEERSLVDTLQRIRRSTEEHQQLLFAPLDELFSHPPGEPELTKLLLGVALNAQVTLSSVAELPLSLPPLNELEPLPLSGAVQKRVLYRAAETYNRLRIVREHLSVALAPPRELARISAAESELQQAYRRSLFHETDPQRATAERRDAFRALIAADVELDAVEHPEVDPTTGWIAVQTPAEPATRITVDTHLCRFYIDPARNGALTELDYKPRRYNLVHPSTLTTFTAALVAQLPNLEQARELAAATPDRANRYLVTRHTRDLLGLRLVDPIASGVLLIKDFTFKAGIGAHLPNSTTGLQLECWLEGERAPSGFLALNIGLLMPCADPRPVALRPLLCVGGVADPMPLTEDCLLAQDALPGGCFGARMVDGVSGFFIDLRTSKPLNVFASVGMHSVSGEFLGTSLVMVCEARRVFGDDKPLTLFASIH